MSNAKTTLSKEILFFGLNRVVIIFFIWYISFSSLLVGYITSISAQNNQLMYERITHEKAL